MRKVAVCLKPQKTNIVEGYSVWRHFPLGMIGIRTLNYTFSVIREYDVELIAFVMAPYKYLEKIQELYYWGFSKIVLISDARIAGADSLGTAKILSKAISKYDCDFVVTGKSSEDSSTGQVPMQMAMALNARYCTDKSASSSLILENRRTIVAVECNYSETFPSIANIQNGSRKVVDIISLSDLGLEDETLRYTDVVKMKEIELDNRDDQMVFISAQKAVEVIKRIIEVRSSD